MRCMICGQNVTESGALLRVNDKGKPGVWSCKPHYESARAYFPDDDPSAPGPAPADDWDSKPLGPWTGGVTPLEDSKATLADANSIASDHLGSPPQEESATCEGGASSGIAASSNLHQRRRGGAKTIAQEPRP